MYYVHDSTDRVADPGGFIRIRPSRKTGYGSDLKEKSDPFFLNLSNQDPCKTHPDPQPCLYCHVQLLNFLFLFSEIITTIKLSRENKIWNRIWFLSNFILMKFTFYFFSFDTKVNIIDILILYYHFGQ